MEYRLRDQSIKLGQFLKAVGWAETGSDAKRVILQGKVRVNGTVVTQRGKKCYDGDVILFEGQEITVRKP